MLNIPNTKNYTCPPTSVPPNISYQTIGLSRRYYKLVAKSTGLVVLIDSFPVDSSSPHLSLSLTSISY
jgi:hypothetical protein